MTSTEPREVWLSGMEHIRLAQELIDGVVNDERGTGRTTRLALHYILIALTAPDHKVLVVDHFNSRVAHENLMQLMCRLLDSLNIDYEIGTETKKTSAFLDRQAHQENDMKTPTFTRAYKEILDYIHQFCINRMYYGPERNFPISHGALSGFIPEHDADPVRVGDLVQVTCGHVMHWRFSWVDDIKTHPGGEKEYLLRSAENGEMCWWSNVSICYFIRKDLADRVNWKWNDEQYEFWDKWLKAAKLEGEYLIRPCAPEFDDKGNATISVRTRWGLDSVSPSRFVVNYRKTTIKSLRALYLELVEESNQTRKKDSCQQQPTSTDAPPDKSASS